MNTYEYNPTNLTKDQNGVVIAVQFTITASDGTDSFIVNNQTALPAPTGDIIPYEQLSKEEVITWIKKLVGTQSEELADAELAGYIKRKTQKTSHGTPWS